MAEDIGFPSRYKGTLILPRPSNSGPHLVGGRYFSLSSSSSSSSSVIGRSAALKIHSEAEKNRRERINVHLSTLRRMIPGANKMDKASLLAEVVGQVKSLKRKTAAGFSDLKEIDEVNVVELHGAEDHSSTICMKASVCCDDRPNLFADLIGAFNELRLRAIRADITCFGGRAHSVFMLCCKDGECLSSLKDSLVEALGRIIAASSSVPSEDAVLKGKRQRLMDSQCFMPS